MRSSVWQELMRRNVYRVAIAYLVAAWLILQITDIVGPILGAPNWFLQAVLSTLAIGFVLALVLSWLYEITPAGVKLEKDVDRSQSATQSTGRKLDFAIIGLMGLVITFLIVDNYVIDLNAPNGFVIDDRSIAVLPFSVRGSTTGSEALVGGLHEDIIVRLAKLSTLDRVISFGSVKEFGESDLPPSSIGSQLDVAVVVTGSLQSAGDRIRLNVQMFDVQSDKHLWAESYERDLSLESAFDIQSSLAQDIVTQLNGALTVDELNDLNVAPTANIDAYNEYVLGRYLFSQRNGPAVEEALQHFERAAELDPGYADAHVGVAQSVLMLTIYGMETRDYASARIRDVLMTATNLNPRNGQALATLAYSAFYFDGDSQKSNSLFLESQALSPSALEPYHWYSVSLRQQDRYDEAVANIRRAIELNPKAKFLRSSLGLTLGAAGRIEESIASLEEAHQMDPSFLNFAGSLADLHYAIGQIDRALVWSNVAFQNGEKRPASLYVRNRSRMTLQLVDEVRNFVSTIDHSDEAVRVGPAMTAADLFLIDGDFESARQILISTDHFDPIGESEAWFTYRLLLLEEIEAATEILRAISSALLADPPEPVRPTDACRAAVTGGVLLKSGKTERGSQLLEESLKVMKTMHRTRGVGYGICDVLVYLIRDEFDLADAAFIDAVETGWRHEWWLLELPFFDQMRKRPAFQLAIEKLHSDIGKQKVWYLENGESEIQRLQGDRT